MCSIYTSICNGRVSRPSCLHAQSKSLLPNAPRSSYIICRLGCRKWSSRSLHLGSKSKQVIHQHLLVEFAAIVIRGHGGRLLLSPNDLVKMEHHLPDGACR